MKRKHPALEAREAPIRIQSNSLLDEDASGDAGVAELVEWTVADVDNIVRIVGFLGWQGTKAGEHQVQKALRKVVYVDYKIKDGDLFNRAFGYVRQYY